MRCQYRLVVDGYLGSTGTRLGQPLKMLLAPACSQLFT